MTGILVPTDGISAEGHRRLRQLAATGDVGFGVLAPGIDPRAAANTLSRALGSRRTDPTLQRMHTAENLQTLVDTLAVLVGNSVTIETPNHELLASSPTGSDVDRNREETILHRRGTGKIMGHPDFEGHMARVRSSDWPIHIPPYPELGFAGRVVMRVAAEGEIYAIIWVTDTARPLTQDDYALVRQAAQVAAPIFLQQRTLARREAQLRAELLEDVIQGRISSPENVRTVARTLGWNVDRVQQAMVVAIDDFESFRLRHAGRTGARLQTMRERLTELVKLEVLAVDPDAMVGLRSSAVVVLLDPNQEGEGERKAAGLRVGETIVHRVAAFLKGVTVTVGLGRDFPSFEHMAESFRQAELAVELGQTLWGGKRAIHYDDLGVHRVLFSVREHEGMMPPGLQRMIDYDAEHGTDYVRTLSAYLRHMGRLRPAAQQLGIHRNTLEYRIARIGELAGVDLDDPDNRLALDLGVRLLDLKYRARMS
jgi:sugar diacid utilization regulator